MSPYCNIEADKIIRFIRVFWGCSNLQILNFPRSRLGKLSYNPKEKEVFQISTIETISDRNLNTALVYLSVNQKHYQYRSCFVHVITNSSTQTTCYLFQWKIVQINVSFELDYRIRFLLIYNTLKSIEYRTLLTLVNLFEHLYYFLPAAKITFLSQESVQNKRS